ncbi:hypothetical protein DICPUDRAFT_150403 [Dictyostelium purpureum]|uniref:non-specific serine/threonine protein kinase n=1 Tax=Dictyostelium purpureum TaxID=5786 RepID=F0ZG89_DICPU|nr:uncharacterized protein DICPUDRAFT_150403 [Dictyostelium purpureum]EGC37076.1 hypothetical protein DICPUDRAFT_150403 [Dictyostelium purpureum]|eukprot:XP_003286433.1 hypothetical protein DICPUDRAFT_150403 [Dictyostelium purpureum]
MTTGIPSQSTSQPPTPTQSQIQTQNTNILNDNMINNNVGLLISLTPQLVGNIEIKFKVGDNISIGRSKTCNIIISDIIISGKHCMISRADSGQEKESFGLLLVQDLSTNGTFINGKLIGKGLSRVIKSGDRLTLGKSTKEIDISFLYKSNNIQSNSSNNEENVEFLWEKKGIKSDVLKDYDFIRELGSGNFSIVYEGINKTTSKRVAIKHLNLTKVYTQSNKFKSQLNREIEILKFVKHENIIEIFDIFYTNDQQLFFILELANGGELYNKIGFNEPLLNEIQAKFIFKQILVAISYLHSKGIAHRDLKPENILFESFGEDYLKIKITDFGLARFIHEGELAKTLCGSPLYVAPEVILSLGKANPRFNTSGNYNNSNNNNNGSPSPTKKDLSLSTGYGKSCDAWSLGAILYIILSGTPPFDDKDDEEISTPQLFERIISGNYKFPTYIWSKISRDAADLVKRLLTVDPSKRYTVEQALAHPWIKGLNENTNPFTNKPISPPILSSGQIPPTSPVKIYSDSLDSNNIVKDNSNNCTDIENNNDNDNNNNNITIPTTLKRNLSSSESTNGTDNNNINNSFISGTNTLLNQLNIRDIGEPVKKRKTFYKTSNSKENIYNNPFLSSSQ